MASPDEQALLSKGKYPASQHLARVVERLAAAVPGADRGVIYLEGRPTRYHESCDQEEDFRQRRYFYYLTGCDLPDCHFVYDAASARSYLLVPPVDPASVVWSGMPLSPEEALARYDVHEARLSTDLPALLRDLTSSFSSGSSSGSSGKVFYIPCQVTEPAGRDFFASLPAGHRDADHLQGVVDRCRAVKSAHEVALIRRANAITAAAHRAVLERVRAASNETELEAVFLERCVARGAKRQAYHPIVASGRAAATLHYTANDAPLRAPEGKGKAKLNLLLDAGCEVSCYASDVTRTFPLSGRFTPESRAIYDVVLKMQEACAAMLREGVRWEDVHVAAHRVLIEGLLALGILRGGGAEEILGKRVSCAFLPHGLGHYLGLDTHDTGGDANYEDPDVLFSYLRIRGTLPAGAVVTVEPGIYFCKYIIDPYLKDPKTAPYIDAQVLERYYDVGGVRIEDNLLITADGSENLTTAVKDVAEMEAIISSSSS